MPGQKTFIVEWVDMICNKVAELGEEALHVQVIQCLLIVVSNPMCEVHHHLCTARWWGGDCPSEQSATCTYFTRAIPAEVCPKDLATLMAVVLCF